MKGTPQRISRMEWVRQLEDKLRAKEPWRYPPRNPDILTIEEVAGLLYCSVDQARRIPRDQLSPKLGPGKRAIYTRKDVVRYAETLPDKRGREFPLPRRAMRSGQTATSTSAEVAIDLDEAIQRLGVKRGTR